MLTVLRLSDFVMCSRVGGGGICISALEHCRKMQFGKPSPDPYHLLLQTRKRFTNSTVLLLLLLLLLFTYIAHLY